MHVKGWKYEREIRFALGEMKCVKHFLRAAGEGSCAYISSPRETFILVVGERSGRCEGVD